MKILAFSMGMSSIVSWDIKILGLPHLGPQAKA